MDNKVDIKENYIYKLDNELLEILLQDHSSNKNLIWATDIYASRGFGYQSTDYITLKAIIGKYGLVIKPRVKKSKNEQAIRIRDKAEVFTPSWICNAQNNLVDEAWFGRKNVFNVEGEKGWKAISKKVVFPEGKTWQDYIKENRLEISCGEAPYLVSRYDTVSGEVIEIKDRIGLLDRKLRIISENINSEPEWVKNAIIAYKSIFGYDWQGDNVLLARENLLLTFIDYYTDKFNIAPIKEYLIEIATVISWNIWQMDGLKFVIPNTCKPQHQVQMSIFPEDNGSTECYGCIKNNIHKHIGTYCRIMNWDKNRSKKFISLIGRKK